MGTATDTFLQKLFRTISNFLLRKRKLSFQKFKLVKKILFNVKDGFIYFLTNAAF
jgi:hypothetical protein